jgi:hypothetical protein
MSYSGLHTNIDSVLCLTYHHMAHIVHTVPFLMILALLLVVVVVAVNASEHQSTGSGSPMDRHWKSCSGSQRRSIRRPGKSR